MKWNKAIRGGMGTRSWKGPYEVSWGHRVGWGNMGWDWAVGCQEVFWVRRGRGVGWRRVGQDGDVWDGAAWGGMGLQYLVVVWHPIESLHQVGGALQQHLLAGSSTGSGGDLTPKPLPPPPSHGGPPAPVPQCCLPALPAPRGVVLQTRVPPAERDRDPLQWGPHLGEALGVPGVPWDDFLQPLEAVVDGGFIQCCQGKGAEWGGHPRAPTASLPPKGN